MASATSALETKTSGIIEKSGMWKPDGPCYSKFLGVKGVTTVQSIDRYAEGMEARLTKWKLR
jgi:hypothetical protein